MNKDKRRNWEQMPFNARWLTVPLEDQKNIDLARFATWLRVNARLMDMPNRRQAHQTMTAIRQEIGRRKAARLLRLSEAKRKGWRQQGAEA